MNHSLPAIWGTSAHAWSSCLYVDFDVGVVDVPVAGGFYPGGTIRLRLVERIDLQGARTRGQPALVSALPNSGRKSEVFINLQCCNSAHVVG